LQQSGKRVRGIALVAAASVVWSTGGLFVRFLDLDLWTMQAWRALFSALSLLVVVIIDKGGQAPKAFYDMGRLGLLAAPVAAVSMICFVAALKLTTVANVMVIYATVPFVAAAVAYLWVREKIERRTLIASLGALFGIAIMAGSATRPSDLAGNALSFLMTLSFAVLLVMARRYPSMAMAPINALGALLCALFCFPLVPGVMPSASEMLVLAIFGATTTGFAYLLFLNGGRLIPSSEAGLVGLLDVPLAPLWVWLVFGEEPTFSALIGGAIALAAVIWCLWGLREVKLEREVGSLTARLKDAP
jgi:drug/metabolite transporter (DMT)-like permease